MENPNQELEAQTYLEDLFAQLEMIANKNRDDRVGNKPRTVFVKREKKSFLDMPQAPVDDLNPHEGLGYVRRSK